MITKGNIEFIKFDLNGSNYIFLELKKIFEENLVFEI